MVRRILNKFVEPTAFIVVFFVIVNRVIIGGGWINIAHSTFEKVILECILWVLDGVLFLWIASQNKNSSEYVPFWKKNWLLLVFILYAISSLFWSEFLVVSLYKIYVLFFCSAITAYIGITYPIRIIFDKLTWFFIVAVILSYGMVLIFPVVSIHQFDENAGAWRGLFFQKNTLGIMMALGSVVFLYGFSFGGKKPRVQFLNICLFILAAGLVFLSRSAAGILIFLILIACAMVVFAWVKWNHKLNRIHYVFIGCFTGLLVILALAKLDFLLGLLHKNSTLTGRVPFWSYLIHSGVSKHLLFGGGFGYPWASDPFR